MQQTNLNSNSDFLPLNPNRPALNLDSESHITDLNQRSSQFQFLTLISDLDLAPGTNQFVASPPVRYLWLLHQLGI